MNSPTPKGEDCISLAFSHYYKVITRQIDTQKESSYSIFLHVFQFLHSVPYYSDTQYYWK